MEGLSSVIVFCLWCGTICLCIRIIICAILNWMKSDNTKQSRLNIMAGIAFGVLCILALLHLKSKEAVDGDTIIFLLKIVLGILLLGCAIISVAALMILVIRCLLNGIRHILHIKQSPESIQSEALADIFNNTAVIFVIALGIISVFLVLPFLAVPLSGTNVEEDKSLVESWNDGIEQIDNLFDITGETSASVNENMDNNNPEENQPKAWITYTLIYIILLGVGVAATEILYSVIERTLRKKKKANLIDEYSSPIALLAVGVSLLIMLQKGDFSRGDSFDKIVELVKSYGTVILIAAITILTLEIIRLLLDIRNTYIRQEARYIFIALIGQVSLLLIGILNSISSAFSNAIENAVDAGEYPIYEKLRRKIIDLMNANIDANESLSPDFQTEDEDGFRPFEEKVTKK